MNHTKQIRNSKGKIVNCLKVVKFTPAPAAVAAVKKPKPPRNHTTTIVNSKGKKVNCIKIVSSKLTPEGEKQQAFALLKKGINRIISQAENEVRNLRK